LCVCIYVFWLLADIKRSGPAIIVAEAEGATYTGIVMLLVTLLPIGVLIGFDVKKMVKNRKNRMKRKKQRRLKAEARRP